MSGWSLLDEKEEAELHKSRLLNVEEKPFKRITKRLQTLNSLAAAAVRQAPTPPPESNGSTTDPPPQDGGVDTPAASFPADADDTSALSALKEDIALDFAAFDSSIARLQFLLSANARERDRYAADRVRIQDTSRRVRDETGSLRTRLEAAREQLARRRRFDELADQITANSALRPRAEQAANLARLEDECRRLELESAEYTRTWRERREQFERIMEESMRLRRQIRDEKEEVERREGMDDDDAGQGGGGGGGGSGGAEAGEADGTPRHGLASGNATPRPDAAVAAVARVGGLDGAGGGGETTAAGTSRAASSVGGRTPARDGSVGPTGAESQGRTSLKVRPDAARSFSRNGSLAPSREGSPKIGGGDESKGGEAGSDVEMDDAKGRNGTPDSPLTPVPDEIPSIVLEAEGKDGSQDKMDTT